MSVSSEYLDDEKVAEHFSFYYIILEVRIGSVCIVLSLHWRYFYYWNVVYFHTLATRGKWTWWVSWWLFSHKKTCGNAVFQTNTNTV